MGMDTNKSTSLRPLYMGIIENVAPKRSTYKCLGILILSLRWSIMTFVIPGAFQLYDTDKSDSISKDEMHKVVTVKDA